MSAVFSATAAFAEGDEPGEPEIREGQLWTYDASTQWLTEIVGEGVTPWAFKVTDAGILCEKTSGANKTVDLRAATMPENAPAIVMIDDEYTAHWKVRTDSTCETLFLPESLTNLTGHVFYQWKTLKRVEFPIDATEFSLVHGNAGMFNGSLVTNIVLPQALRRIEAGQFSAMAKLVYARLPDELEHLGETAFDGCTSLVRIEPQLPRPIAFYGHAALRGCPLSGTFELGYGTNGTDQTPIMVARSTDGLNGRMIMNGSGVRTVRLGPGLTDVYQHDFYGCSFTEIEIGCNVTNVQASFPSTLTRVTFNRTEDFSLAWYDNNRTAFLNCKNIQEVVFRGWCDYASSGNANPFRGWSAKQARFLVPATNPKWIAYFNDATKVTPWQNVAVADRNAYYSKYGKTATEPIGLSVSVANGLSSTWIVPAPSEALFTLGEVDPQPVGATPVPALYDAAGDELDSANFVFSYIGMDAAGIGTLIATGKAGTAYAGQSVSSSFVVSARSAADTFTWKACASGDFEDDANWTTLSGNPGHPELAGDIVVLPKFMSDSSYTVTVKKPFTIGALTVGDTSGVVGACTVTLVFKTSDRVNKVRGDVLVKTGGTITHYGPADTQNDVLNLQVGGDCTVEADGFIHADGKGHNSNKGPGLAAMLNGASHAGQGKGASGGPYGSVLHPVKWGSATSGAQGGGAVHLDVGGTLTVNGRVSANGAPDNTHYTSCGGSLWIECGALAGSGRVEARDGQTNGRTANYTSSGGRIAVYQRTATDFTAFPVTQMATVQYGLNAAGTIYLESAGGRRDLYVIGGAQDAPQKTPFPMPDDGNDLTQYADLNVHVTGCAHLSVCDLKLPSMTVPIRSLEVVNKAMMTIGAGSVLQVSGDVDLTGAKAASVAGGGWLEFVGGDAVSFRGAAAIGALGGLVCTNAGKVIRFGTAAGDKLTIGLGVGIVVKGTEDAPVQLLSETDGTPWALSLNANPGVAEFEHVALKDSDASTGAPALAISSQNLGGNTNWGFSNPIVPGETITWKGALSAKWDAAENWSPSRAPVETDRIVIPADAANDPTLPSGTYLFNAIEIVAGAALTLNGCTLTVTNDLACAGGFVFTDDEDLYLSGDATFAANSITVNNARIHLIGSGEQTVDFCETALHNVYVEKDGGGVTFAAHGFSADSFACAASAPQYLAFAAGQTYNLPTVSLSSIGADRQLILKSDAPGTAWKLVTTESGQNISSVEVHDSDASEGALIIAGTKSVATDNCTNWDTVTSVATWLGGSGDWTNPAKWSTGEVPGEGDLVTVAAAESETLTLTVPAGTTATMKGLTILAAAGGLATVKVNGALNVISDVIVRERGVLELNSYVEDGAAPNVVRGNVSVLSGGKIAHAGPANTENAKVHLKVLGDVTIDEGGAIDVTARGHNPNSGPGRASTNGYSPSYGGWGNTIGNTSLPPYGSILHPFDWGSGGPNNGNPRGGGAIRLEVEGTLTVDGGIKADGSDGSPFYTGAGGSVWITCGTLSGDGTISARTGAASSPDTRYTGAGGRIAVYQTVGTDFTAFPPERIVAGRNMYSASGTVYLEAADTSNGTDLYVQGTGNSTARKTPFPMPDDGSDYSIYSNVNVHVGIAAVLAIGERTGAAVYPIRSLEVLNGGAAELVAGSTLMTRCGVTVGNKSTMDFAGGTLDLVGDGMTTLEGFKRVSNIGSLVCTNAGKVVSVATGANDVIGLGAGANLLLQGEEGNPVTLLPLDGTASWQLDANANANLAVKYVAASNSTALTQAVLAMESEDLGGNVKWSFVSEIKPDAPIHWTGDKSTDWADVENWDEKRTPILTDKVYVDNVANGNYPVLANGIFTQLKLYVETGAKLTLSDATLVVSNEFAMAGELIFAGAEELCLTGDADFKGGSVQPQDGVVRLQGDGYQTIDFGGVSLRFLKIDKPEGTVVMNGGLTASMLRCDASAPLEIQFAQGVFFDVADLYLNGGAQNLTLKSTQTGGTWSLKATADNQCVSGVKVSGCMATDATIYAGTSSSDEGGNVNWDFAAETAVWLGGSGDWTDASHWSLGAVPTAGSQVMLNVDEDADVTITIPKDNAASVASVDVRAAGGGKAKIVANSPLAVAGNVGVGQGSVLELNCYADGGEAPNVVGGDVVVRAGGRITHTGPADVESAKVHLKVAGDVTVEEGGSVDADAKGYSKAKGPGSTGTMCQGAAHAGKGHGNGAQPYGSVFRPAAWGSGNSGCCGGGAVHLVVSGTLTVDGRISADSGVNGVYVGAGGSVWVECARLVGGGSMSVAEGARPQKTANLSDCTSSGGRIAVYQRVASDFSAFPLAQMYTSWLGSNAAGTIYLESVGCPGQLLIDLGNRAVYDSTQRTALFSKDEVDLGKFAEVNVTVRGTASAVLYADVTVRDLVLVASDTAGKKVPKLELGGHTMKVRSVRHENGRKWFKSLDEAIESGHVILGGTQLNPGKILWIGGADGAFLWIR